MKSRRQAREVALQALYQLDTLGDWSDECIQLFFSVFKPELLKELPDAQKENVAFLMLLIRGVRDNLDALDKFVSSASIHWSVSRMARVDRNILRIAAFEIVFLDEIPNNVSINEGIEIAKRFASDDSPTFINGVLDRVSRMAIEEGMQVRASAEKNRAAG